MKVYAEYFTVERTKYNSQTMKREACEPYNNTFCGSDSVCVLDGRHNLYNLVKIAKEQAYKRRNIVKIDGFNIIRANSFRDRSRIVHTEYYSNR